MDYFLKIASLSNKWITAKNISKKFIEDLNTFNRNFLPIQNEFDNFFYSFFNDLLLDIVQKKKLLVCPECGDIIQYKHGKKYCSIKTEGKDCGKKARNKKYYKKHSKEIRPKARKTTKELREFYTEKGIKKYKIIM